MGDCDVLAEKKKSDIKIKPHQETGAALIV